MCLNSVRFAATNNTFRLYITCKQLFFPNVTLFKKIPQHALPFFLFFFIFIFIYLFIFNFWRKIIFLMYWKPHHEWAECILVGKLNLNCVVFIVYGQAAVTHWFPSDHQSLALLSGVSIWMGGHPATLGAVGYTYIASGGSRIWVRARRSHKTQVWTRQVMWSWSDHSRAKPSFFPGVRGHAPPKNFENRDAQICVFSPFGSIFEPE